MRNERAIKIEDNKRKTKLFLFFNLSIQRSKNNIPRREVVTIDGSGRIERE